MAIANSAAQVPADSTFKWVLAQQEAAVSLSSAAVKSKDKVPATLRLHCVFPLFLIFALSLQVT